MASLADQAALAPPENFAMVWKGIYRSGYPSKRNLTFLRTLGLRSILFLCPEDYPDSHLGFLEECGIQLLQFGVVGNKEPFDEIPEDVLRAALDAVLDQSNQPILIALQPGQAPHGLPRRLPAQGAALVARRHLRGVPPLRRQQGARRRPALHRALPAERRRRPRRRAAARAAGARSSRSPREWSQEAPVKIPIRVFTRPGTRARAPARIRDDSPTTLEGARLRAVACVLEVVLHAPPSLNDAHHRPGFSRLESTRAARSAQPGGSAGGDGGGLGGAGGGGGGGADTRFARLRSARRRARRWVSGSTRAVALTEK